MHICDSNTLALCSPKKHQVLTLETGILLITDRWCVLHAESAVARVTAIRAQFLNLGYRLSTQNRQK